MLRTDLDMWNAMLNESYDLEFDWFALDVNNNLAVFSSFNRGFIPRNKLTSFTDFQKFQDWVDSLGETSNAILVTLNSGDFSDWINYSKKGFFSYDYQDAHRTLKTNKYDLIAKPEKPLSIIEIPEIKNQIINLPKFNLSFEKDISFEELKSSLT